MSNAVPRHADVNILCEPRPSWHLHFKPAQDLTPTLHSLMLPTFDPFKEEHFYIVLSRFNHASFGLYH